MKTIHFIFISTVTLYVGAQPTEAIFQKLDNPAQGQSAEVNLTVNGEILYMSWIQAQGKKQGTLYLASYDGDNWSKPIQIRKSGQLFINWADFPKVAVTDHFMAAVWPEYLGEGVYDYGLMVSTSSDNGTRWSEPQWLHEDRSKAEHGFISMAPLDDKRIMAVWLDGRAMTGGHGEGGGAMQLRSRILDDKGLGEEMLVDDSTCECCNTTLILAGKTPLVAYRNKSENNIRDIYLSRFENGRWIKGEPIHNDNWEIQGCPVNGPSLAINDQLTAITWFTGIDGGKVQLKVSDDGARTFKHHATVDGQAQGRVDCQILQDERIVVSWITFNENRSVVKSAVYELKNDLNLMGTPIIVDQTPEGRISGFPRLAVFKEALYIAYQNPNGNGIKLQRTAFSQP